MEHRLDRIIKLADSILDRLNSEERLSNILPQIRLLADMSGDGAFVAWTDAEIYGILRVPLAPLPREKAEDKQGGVLFAKLHQMPDIGSMDYREDILNAFKSQRLSKYDKVST